MSYIRFIVDGIWFIIGFLGISNFFCGNGLINSIIASLPLVSSSLLYFYLLFYRNDFNRLYATGSSIATFLLVFYFLNDVLFRKNKEEKQI